MYKMRWLLLSSGRSARQSRSATSKLAPRRMCRVGRDKPNRPAVSASSRLLRCNRNLSLSHHSRNPSPSRSRSLSHNLSLNLLRNRNLVRLNRNRS